jgi:hypothetical protein
MMSATMTADRFRECLAMLHWSQRGLAEILYCDDRLVRRWAQGSEPVPESIAGWIEKMACVRQTSPRPTSRWNPAVSTTRRSVMNLAALMAWRSAIKAARDEASRRRRR